jgi:NAD(P)-dependent dehydrogenase (short-subunit alcohol dehydrogenase family)
MELKDKVAVVTGASSGVGRELALEFARQGAKVVCAARREGKLRDTVSMIEAEGGKAFYVLTDVTDRVQVQHLFDETINKFGPVDVLFNNAGTMNAIGASWELDIDTWWHDIQVDLLGTYICCHTFLPHMIEKNSGVIINMEGGGGTNGSFPGASAYGCAKVAIVRFTESLADELKSINSSVITVTLNPGFVATELSKKGVDTDYKAKWAPHILDKLVNEKGVPADRCAQTAVKLLKIISPELSGRAFKNGTDYDKVANNLEKIQKENLFVLKYITLD